MAAADDRLAQLRKLFVPEFGREPTDEEAEILLSSDALEDIEDDNSVWF